MDRRSAVVALAAVAATFALVSPATSAQTAVTSCGQSVNGAAFLTGDLDCSGFNGHAVSFMNGKLDMRGFTITGGLRGRVFR